MRILRVLPLLFAIGGGLLGAGTVEAADVPVSLTLTQRWNAGQPGGWTPYVATVRNDGAVDFTGDVRLAPIPTTRTGGLQGWPEYHARLTVPHGGRRSLTFYVIEPPQGYQASLSDSGGHPVVSDVSVSGLVDGVYTVAVLSDQPQASGRIEALKPLAAGGGFNAGGGLRVSGFTTAQDFPTSAVLLSGLNAVVVDDFDVSTLSDAQVRALRDFVGLGGSLVAAGGASWRRTLLPLAQKGLAGLSPSRSAEAALQPLADLIGRTTAATAPVAVGDIVSGRALVGAPGSAPLVVEAAYGAGRIIDLAYDPLAEPFATDSTGLDALAWSLAVDRAVLETGAAGGRVVQAAPGSNPGPPRAVSPGSAVAGDEIISILQNTPAAAVPPVGLLGALLVFYVLLAGPLNYLAMRGLRRRELMWISVPLVALLFTSAAYVVGSGLHGANYFDNEVQVLRLGPDGVAEVHAYHGLYAPHRGDFAVDVAGNTLASTALGSGGAPSPQTAVVDLGPHSRVVLKDTTYGGFRSLQTLSIARPPLQPAVSLETHLKIVHDRVTGTVRNTGERAIERLTLVRGTGQQAVLAGELAPRATITVDAPISSAGAATFFPQAPGPSPGSAGYKRDALLRVADGAAVSGRPGDWSLTGLTDPSGGLVVDGNHPSHSGLAALVAPVAMESVDSLTLAPQASTIINDTSVPYHYDVFDLVIPAGYSGPVQLAYDAMPTGVNASLAPVRSIEVYDWDSGTWRSLPATAAAGPGGVRANTIALRPGETRGAVRVRVNEQTDYPAANMKLVAS